MFILRWNYKVWEFYVNLLEKSVLKLGSLLKNANDPSGEFITFDEEWEAEELYEDIEGGLNLQYQWYFYAIFNGICVSLKIRRDVCYCT